MDQEVHRYFVLYKPYGLVSQFTSSNSDQLLDRIGYPFPAGTHAIGRLDKESEGLLLLTTDKSVTRLLFQGHMQHKRTYLVQVRHLVQAPALERLQQGVQILTRKGGGLYTTPPCAVEMIDPPQWLPAASFAVPAQLPTTWLQMTLFEGKYRQIRKMVGAVKHRCLRLVRTSIEDVSVQGLQPGQVAELSAADFFQQLKLQRALTSA